MCKKCEKYQQQQEQGIVNIETPTVEMLPALTSEKEKLLFSKIDLSGTKDQDPDLIEKTRKLFHECAHIFTLESLDMGHTLPMPLPLFNALWRVVLVNYT